MAARVCEKCGGEITDLRFHPRAKQCPTCRGRARNAKVYVKHHDYVPVVREYLERHGWPTYVRAAHALEDDPSLVEALGTHSPVSAKVRFTICAREVRGPHGERYVSWSNKGRVLMLESPDKCTPQEVTA